MQRRTQRNLTRYRWIALGVVPAIVTLALATACGSLADTSGTPGAGTSVTPDATGVTATPGLPIPSTTAATAICCDTPTPVASIPPGVTPVVITPVPASTARPDCASGSFTTADARFSFCFPTGLKILRGVANGFTSYNVFTPDDAPGSPPPIFVVLTLEPTRDVDPAKSCAGASGLYGAHDFSTQQIDVHGTPVTACVASGNDGGGAARSIMLSIPEGSVYLNISALYRGDDSGPARASVEAILQSVEIQ